MAIASLCHCPNSSWIILMERRKLEGRLHCFPMKMNCLKGTRNEILEERGCNNKINHLIAQFIRLDLPHLNFK